MQPRAPLTDESPMPFGPHKGTALKDVPAEHLLWLINQPWIGSYKILQSYLKERKDGIEKAVAASKPQQHQDAPQIDTFEDYLRSYRGF